MPDFSQTLVSLQNWLHTQPVSLERFLQHEKGQLRGWLKDHLTPLKQVDACNLLCLSIEQKIPERLYQRLQVQKLGVEFASRQQIQLFMQQRSIAESRATWAVLFWCAVLGEKVTVPSYPELKPRFDQLPEAADELVQLRVENHRLQQYLESVEKKLKQIHENRQHVAPNNSIPVSSAPTAALAQANQCPSPAPRLKNQLGMDFVWIEPGSFMMGSADGQGHLNERPQHHVILTQGFYLQTTQVTQAQWEAVMGNNPSQFKGDKHRPVESVSWEDVQEYLTKLNQRGEGQYRLPTEAEWEYACRAESTTAYCFGDDVSRLGEYAWYADNSGKIQDKWFGLKQEVTDQKTHPVAQKKPNAWGLYDMHGNVWEWVQDWYGPYGSGAQTNPTGPSTGEKRVYRGGSWDNIASYARCSYRFTYYPGLRRNHLGFRLVRSA